MYINFSKIHIEGFQSIGDAIVSLSNQGIVSIKGVNNYEENSDSNGSGKSSIFESILFAIYGRTSSGITDPSNRYLNTGCCVELFFNASNVDYRIVRSVNHNVLKTSLKVFKEDEEISSRNKTDSQKIIDEIFKCQQDIFTSTIYLNQGLNSRLSALQPSGRKSRLENLADISDKLESFKKKINNYVSDISDKYNDTNALFNKFSGIVESTRSTMKNTLACIDNYNKENNNIIKEIKELKDKEDKIYEALNNEKSYIVNELHDSRKKKEFYELKKNNLLRELSSVNNSLNNLSDICPNCGQKIPEDVYKNSKQKKENEIGRIKNAINIIDNSISEILPKISNLEIEKKDVINKIDESVNKRANYNQKLLTINNSSDLKVLKEVLESNKSTMKDAICSQRETKHSLIELSRRKDVADSIASYVSRDFRTWLLNNVIEFINVRLKHYSEILFSGNDIIGIIENRNRIDIYLGDAKYESLSGGEKRRVDLAITLSERDLAVNVAGISSNILILDEVFDNLDDKGIQTSVKMFTEECVNSDSIFIISHKSELNLPSDYSLLVIKEKNKISHVERM